MELRDDEFLTRKEVAHLLRVSTSTVDRWRKQGKIPFIRLDERGAILFPRSELMRALRKRLVETLPEILDRVTSSPRSG